jgi:hypothetical protein
MSWDGQRYLFEVWVNDSRSNPTRTETVTAGNFSVCELPFHKPIRLCHFHRWNFTKASEKNAENLLVIRNSELAAKYEENWQNHFKHSEYYAGK